MISRSVTISTQTLQEFFKDRIESESAGVTPALQEETCHYLVNILLHFSQSRHLFVVEQSQLAMPTIAFLYQEASQAPTVHHRNTALRQLGDTALFLAALFGGYFQHRGIGRDYLVGMGGAAYSSLADSRYGNPEVYLELSQRFPKLVQLLADVCRNELRFTAEELFALLERWQSSKDEVLRRQLESIGIMPVEFSRRH